MERLPIVTIDEQAWCCHFRTEYRGWLWKPGCWFLAFLKKLKHVAVINTYGVDDGEKVRFITQDGFAKEAAGTPPSRREYKGEGIGIACPEILNTKETGEQ